MVESSGHQIYGQNALRAISRGNPKSGGSLGNPLNANAITMQNQNLLNHLIPYQDPYQNELVKSTDFSQPTHLPNIMGANKRNQNSNRGQGASGSKSLLDGSGAQRDILTADGHIRPGIVQPSDGAYPGVQASHLGVYRHDTSVSLMKYNVNGQLVQNPQMVGN